MIHQQILFPEEKRVNNQSEIIDIVWKRLQSKSAIRNKQKDKNKKFIQYQVGQTVLIKEHKLSSTEDHEIPKFFLLYKGPYTVTQVFDNNTITVEDDQ